MQQPSCRRRTGLWLTAGVGLACLLTAGGSMTTTDAVIAFEVTRSIVEEHSVATGGTAPTYDAYRGVDGRYYSPFGIAQSIWNIPFYLAGRAAAERIGVAGWERHDPEGSGRTRHHPGRRSARVGLLPAAR